MAFINGKADPWGMRVNPAYKKIELPTRRVAAARRPTSRRPSSECREAEPGAYFTQLAAPVTTLRKIAEALLDAWPNVQTQCDFDPADRDLEDRPRRPAGLRLAVHARLVSLGDAAALRPARGAALETKPATYVGADRRLARERRVAARRASRSGYEPVHPRPGRRASRPARLPRHDDRLHRRRGCANLPQDDAAKVAQFIRIATTEGQRAGQRQRRAPGRLPADPQDRASTASSTTPPQEVADAIAAQDAPTQRTATEEPRAAVAAPAPVPTRRRPGAGTAAVDGPGRTTSPTRAVARGRPRSRGHADAVGEPPARPEPAADAAHAAGQLRPAGGLLPPLILVGLAALAASRRRCGPPSPGRADGRDRSPDAGARRRTPAAGRPPRRPGRPGRRDQRRPRRGSVAPPLTMLALVCLWVVAQLLFLGGLAQHRSQDAALHRVPQRARRRHRADRAGRARSATRSPCSRSRSSASSRSSSRAPRPATCSTVPATSQHRAARARSARRWSTAARRRTAPRSRDLAALVPGDQINVVIGAGHAAVPGARRTPRRRPAAAAGRRAARARLTLVTAEGSGRLAATHARTRGLRRRRGRGGRSPRRPAGPRRSPIRSRRWAATRARSRCCRCAWACSWRLTLGVIAARQRWSDRLSGWSRAPS